MVDFFLAPNISGLVLREKTNEYFAQLVGAQIGATAPSPTFAGQRWLDTSGSHAVLRLRDPTNTAWVSMGRVTASGYLPLVGEAPIDPLAAAKSRLDATAAPGPADNAAAGYARGSMWVWPSARRVWQLVDFSGATAIWAELTGGGDGDTYYLMAPGGAVAGNQIVTLSGASVTATVAVEEDGATVVGAAGRLNFTGSGVTVTDAGNGKATVAVSGAGATNSFGTVAVAGQSSVVADAASDTLTLIAGNGVSIATDAGADSVTLSVAYAGSGSAATAARSDHTHASYEWGLRRAWPFSWAGRPVAGDAVVTTGLPGRTIRVAAGLSSGADLCGGAVTAATSAADFTLARSTDLGATWATVGTIRIASGGRTPAVQSGFSAAVDVGGTDMLRLTAPATQDATLADVAITVAGVVVS